MNFEVHNDNLRAFYNQDFSEMEKLLLLIRNSLIENTPLNLNGVNLDDIIDFNPRLTFVYVSLFQQGLKMVRFGSLKENLEATLNRCIDRIKINKNFNKFDIANCDKCRIMIEYVVSKNSLPMKNIQQNKFNSLRFEIGINGIELNDGKKSYYYLPTDAITESHMGFRSALNSILRKTPISKLTNKFSKRIEILKEEKNWTFSLITTRAFVTYKNKCLPLYRGNILYDKFDYKILINQFISSADWLIENMQKDGRFLYYYDCSQDNCVDHEHPERPFNDLYYNDLRHCGGTITLIRAYSYTGDKKYLNAAKRAIDFTISTALEHNVEGKNAYYIYYNRKCKLGGVGMALNSIMHYRKVSSDKSYDEYIKGFVRHILSRMTPEGELLGYYIHPSYQNGSHLLQMSDEERMATFSFYYPGEALLGLGLFANHFNDDKELEKEVVQKTKKAMDWIVDERPKNYSHLFTALPSDAWLMQAIEEWFDYPDFIKQNHLDFVFNDAKTMMNKMYTKNDSPYIDYEGGYYYDYGDHYYPDGARSEGLIASYYLAKKSGQEQLAKQILEACKLAAKCQFQLFNSEKSNYSHLNPEKSKNSIRFKATRQWVRVDSIQHVACFFIRLYWAEN